MFQKPFPGGSQQTPWAAEGNSWAKGQDAAGREWREIRDELIFVQEGPGGGSVTGLGAAPGQCHSAGGE